MNSMLDPYVWIPAWLVALLLALTATAVYGLNPAWLAPLGAPLAAPLSAAFQDLFGTRKANREKILEHEKTLQATIKGMRKVVGSQRRNTTELTIGRYLAELHYMVKAYGCSPCDYKGMRNVQVVRDFLGLVAVRTLVLKIQKTEHSLPPEAIFWSDKRNAGLDIYRAWGVEIDGNRSRWFGRFGVKS
jgi:hypothetical protein